MTDPVFTTTDLGFAQVVNLARASAHPATLHDGTRVVHTPPGYTTTILPADLAAAHPDRPAGAVRLSTLEGFVAYLERIAPEVGATVPVFRRADPASPLPGLEYVAVLNADAVTGTAGWWDWVVAMRAPVSPELQAWIAARDGGPMNQDRAAMFLEDQIAVVIEPDGADLVEAVTFLSTSRVSTYTGALNLTNGARRVEWSDDVTVSTRGGSTDLPGTLTVAVPMLAGDTETRHVKVRLRYHVTSEGKLKIGLDLPDLSRVWARHVETCDVLVGLTEGVDRVYPGVGAEHRAPIVLAVRPDPVAVDTVKAWMS